MEERERSRHTDRVTGVRVAQGSQRFRESRWLIVWVSCLLLSLCSPWAGALHSVNGCKVFPLLRLSRNGGQT